MNAQDLDEYIERELNQRILEHIWTQQLLSKSAKMRLYTVIEVPEPGSSYKARQYIGFKKMDDEGNIIVEFMEHGVVTTIP